MNKPKKVALAYSGGLDTSVIIPWLRENYGCEVIAFAADPGQAEEPEGREAKARRAGRRGVGALACGGTAPPADLGQAEELEGLEAKALRTGASGFHLRDLREEFI